MLSRAHRLDERLGTWRRRDQTVAGYDGNQPHSVRWPAGIDNRPDISKVLGTDIRVQDCEYTGGFLMRVAELMNRALRGEHPFPGAKISRSVVDRIAQYPLQDVYAFVIL